MGATFFNRPPAPPPAPLFNRRSHESIVALVFVLLYLPGDRPTPFHESIRRVKVWRCRAREFRARRESPGVSAAIGAGRAGLVWGTGLRGNRVGGLPILDEGLAAAI